ALPDCQEIEPRTVHTNLTPKLPGHQKSWQSQAGAGQKARAIGVKVRAVCVVRAVRGLIFLQPGKAGGFIRHLRLFQNFSFWKSFLPPEKIAFT
ncbi:MAG: hypothetical protein LBH26_05760, partial [Treponema sp.]|nr:hypothetical protein [Treponema sp.]